MPLYEYECTACHKRTEKIQKFSDPEITVCPRCGGALERVLSAPAISFKGGGWYADGYGNARPSASSTESTGSGESSGSGGSSDGGGASESKPAASKTGDSAPSSTPAAAPATAASPAPAPGKS
jgi:putative FmdB family regulatory protein